MQCSRGTIQRALDFKDDGRANLFSHFLSLPLERNSVFSGFNSKI